MKNSWLAYMFSRKMENGWWW